MHGTNGQDCSDLNEFEPISVHRTTAQTQHYRYGMVFTHIATSRRYDQKVVCA